MADKERGDGGQNDADQEARKALEAAQRALGLGDELGLEEVLRAEPTRRSALGKFGDFIEKVVSEPKQLEGIGTRLVIDPDTGNYHETDRKLGYEVEAIVEGPHAVPLPLTKLLGAEISVTRGLATDHPDEFALTPTPSAILGPDAEFIDPTEIRAKHVVLVAGEPYIVGGQLGPIVKDRKGVVVEPPRSPYVSFVDDKVNPITAKAEIIPQDRLDQVKFMTAHRVKIKGMEAK